MKMLEVAEFSPSFARMSPAVIEHALHYGAAKVDDMLSEESHEALMEGADQQTAERLAAMAPELGYYFGLLGVTPEDERVFSNYFDVYANTATLLPDIHRDSNIAEGLSLLLPCEKSAVFGADNQQFTEETIPSQVWKYGPRDGIVLRQGIRSYNGRRVQLQQAWHCAVRDRNSEILAIDLHTPELKVDTSVKPYETAPASM